MECHLGVLNFLCILQYSSWCNHVMWLIGNSLPCCHGDQVVTGVPLHVTVATWWSCQSGTQPTRIQTCNSRAWTCIWFHNTNTIWILQLCCVKSFYVGQNPSPIILCASLQVRGHFLHSLDLQDPISSPLRLDESSQNVSPVHILHSQEGSYAPSHGFVCQSPLSTSEGIWLLTSVFPDIRSS